ncbi:MAG: hypothetical protein O8C59_05580, partial [Candidatus Methanoperedens sp.]|nr:hypothetical protein [Candidatus Methanoperedens sp.]
DGAVFHETISKAQSVHFHSDLKERAETEEMVDHVQPLHYTAAESFADNDLLGALAVLLRNREAGKEVFDSSIIEQVHRNIEKKTFTIGSRDEKYVRIDYRDLERKWNVKCFQYSAFEKAILDLV